MQVKCAYCGCKTVDKNSEDYVKEDGKNFHKDCYQKWKEKQEFFDYVCEVFKLKAPGPTIYSQAKTFIEKYDYTYLGMQRALYYIYVVRKHANDRPTASKSIGLIPYYYEEAQKYFKKLDEKKTLIRKEIMNSAEKVVSVKMAAPTTKQKPIYTIEDIENME